MKPQYAIDDDLRKALIQLGVFHMFMENVKQENHAGVSIPTVSHAFYWNNSPQEHDYWSDIYEKTVSINPKLNRDLY